MNKSSHVLKEPRVPGRLFLPSLIVSYFAVQPPLVLLGLLLIDIGLTFDQPVGVAGQIRMTFSLIGMISALLMGAWSLRFNSKSLLLVGLVFLCLSAVGCSLAVNFPMLIIVFSLSGLGLNMIEPMLFVLVGEHFPLEQRAQTIGWVLTGVPLVPILGAPVIENFAKVGGWRLAFLGFALPIAVLGLLLAVKGVPTPTRIPHLQRKATRYMDGFKAVYINRSAMACLIGSALSMGTYQALGFYGASFFRERFLISIGSASVIYGGFAICYIAGLHISGHLATQLGKRPITILTAIFASILVILFTNVTQLWLAITFMFLGGMFFGMLFTTFTSLTLEQVPNFRGTLMALNSAAWSGGAAFGAGMGGLIMLLFDYEVLGMLLGVMSLTTAVLIYFLVNDPTIPKSRSQKALGETKLA